VFKYICLFCSIFVLLSQESDVSAIFEVSMADKEKHEKDHKKSRESKHLSTSPVNNQKQHTMHSFNLRHSLAVPSSHSKEPDHALDASVDEELQRTSQQYNLEHDDRSLEQKRSYLRRERSHSRRMIKYSVSKEPPSRSPSQRSMQTLEPVIYFFLNLDL